MTENSEKVHGLARLSQLVVAEGGPESGLLAQPHLCKTGFIRKRDKETEEGQRKGQDGAELVSWSSGGSVEHTSLWGHTAVPRRITLGGNLQP